jgi:hypothetical protein
MAAVRIDSGPVSANDQLHAVPQSKWHDLMLARRQYLDIHVASDCRCLVEFVNDANVMYAALGFASVNHMIRDGYHLGPAEIGMAVEWLKLRKPDEPVSLDQAVKLGQREIGIEGGKAGPGRGKKTDSNATRFIGRSRAYILARLDRDGHAELAAKVRFKEISANAAAEQMGWREKPTPLQQIKKLWGKLDRAGRNAHLEWTLKHCATCGREGAVNGEWCDACCDEAAVVSRKGESQKQR